MGIAEIWYRQMLQSICIALAQPAVRCCLCNRFHGLCAMATDSHIVRHCQPQGEDDWAGWNRILGSVVSLFSFIPINKDGLRDR